MKQEKQKRRELQTCYVCEHKITGQPQYIGQDMYRHKRCEPGSARWFNSARAKVSELAPYFRTATLAAILALGIGTASAGEVSFKYQPEEPKQYHYTGDKWTWENTALEITLVGFALCDDAQTMRFLRQGTGYEMNPILGKHPSQTRLFVTSAVGLAAHAAITYYLVKSDHKILAYIWQGVWIGIEWEAVEWNRSQGIGVSLHF